MTSVTLPRDLLTMDGWDALGGEIHRWFELVEGVLQLSPAPTVRHQHAVKILARQVDAAWSGIGLESVIEDAGSPLADDAGIGRARADAGVQNQPRRRQPAAGCTDPGHEDKA